ncbi:MAG: hypothetical protein FWG90_02505 [Oscillospiraceae bacterium]|nr:hypothetical protein [Oscillospiraceae bacterium]
MEAFRLITKTACYIGIAAAILDSLYPNERFGKQMKILFTVVFLIIITAPFARGEIDFDISLPTYSSLDSYAEAQEKAHALFVKTAESNINTRLEELLNHHEIYNVKIKTSVNISDNAGISINEVAITLDAPLDFDKASAIIKSELGEVLIKEVDKEWMS